MGGVDETSGRGAEAAQFVALLRGINVGTAKRIAMADLRAALTAAGATDVRTILNSGNAVFRASEAALLDPESVRSLVADATGVDAEVVVLPAATFREIAGANPLRRPEREPKKLGVAFAAGPLSRESALELVQDADALLPEELVVTETAVYQWLPDGVLASAVPAAFWRALGASVTARNDATVQKIAALLDA